MQEQGLVHWEAESSGHCAGGPKSGVGVQGIWEQWSERTEAGVRNTVAVLVSVIDSLIKY